MQKILGNYFIFAMEVNNYDYFDKVVDKLSISMIIFKELNKRYLIFSLLSIFKGLTISKVAKLLLNLTDFQFPILNNQPPINLQLK